MQDTITSGKRIQTVQNRFKNKGLIVGFAAIWLLAMIIIGSTAPLIAPHDHLKINLLARLLPPAWMEGGNTSYFLGTDEMGRDNLSRLYYSIRMSLLVAILGTLICAIIGSLIGFCAAHFRGIVDEIVMMLVDFQASLPYMILALAVIAFVTAGALDLLFDAG